jgi:hypothetical protein
LSGSPFKPPALPGVPDIVDQTGKKWKVKWPSTAFLKNYEKNEKIYSSNKENEKYKLEISGFKIWNFYSIKTSLSEKKQMPTTQYSFKRFSNKQSFDNAIKHLEKEGMDYLLSKGIEKN